MVIARIVRASGLDRERNVERVMGREETDGGNVLKGWEPTREIFARTVLAACMQIHNVCLGEWN